MSDSVAIVSEAAKIHFEHGFCLWWTSCLYCAVLLLLLDWHPSRRAWSTAAAFTAPARLPREELRRARLTCPQKSKAEPGCCFLPFVSHRPGRCVQRPSFERREESSCSRFYSKRTPWKLFSQLRLQLWSLCFPGPHVLFTPGTPRLFCIGLMSIVPSHGLMLVRDLMSRCTSDRTLTVTCTFSHSHLKPIHQLDGTSS